MHRLRHLCVCLAPGCLGRVSGTTLRTASSDTGSVESHTSSGATRESVERRPAVYVPCPRGRLIVVRPELIDDWIPELNNADVETVLCSSPLPVWWRCGRCGGRYCTAVRERVTRGLRCCPHCHGTGTVTCATHDAAPSHNNKEATRDAATERGEGGVQNSLAVTHPALAARWDTTRNAALAPTRVTAGSTRCVWWWCAEANCATSFRRPVCAFVADSRSPTGLQRAEDELEWRLLQRIYDAMSAATPTQLHDEPRHRSGEAHVLHGLLPPDQLAAAVATQPDSKTSTLPEAGALGAMLAVWKRRARNELTQVTSPPVTAAKKTSTASPITETVSLVAHGPGLSTHDARRLRTALLNAYAAVARQRATHTKLAPVLLSGDDKETSWLNYFAHAAHAEGKQQGTDDDTAGHATTSSLAPPSSPSSTAQPDFPVPPSADELANAAAETSELQGRMRLMETRRMLQGRRTAQRTALLFERFMTGMSPEEEAEVLACYPRWRPYAAYAHDEDDVTEATPIETTFHTAALRRHRTQPGQASRATRPPRRQRPVFSFPSAADTLRALNLDYDNDDESEGGSGVKQKGEGELTGASAGETPSEAVQQAPYIGDDGDIDLATRLRVSTGHNRAQSDTTAAESRASLVDLAVRALGDSVVGRADAQAVQLEQEVMQSLRPLPQPGDMAQVAATSTAPLVPNAELQRRRRVRMQMPAEVKEASHGALTAPRTPRKVARPRRATSETSN